PFSGFVTHSAGVGLSGVTVQVLEHPTLTAATAGDGGFTIAQIPPAQNFTIKASAAGAADTYLGPLNSVSDIDGKIVFVYTVTESSNWGLLPGKGAIKGRVFDNANPAAYLDATVVTANSRLHPAN